MDVLHFMKEEYSAVKEESLGLLPGDFAESVRGNALHRFMARLDLMLRVGDELIIPELTDSGSRHVAAGLLAEGQSSALARFLAIFKKSGAVAETKREDFFRKVSSHIDHMEKVVLPIIRETIPTAVREDIGLIAIDYRDDVGALLAKTAKCQEGSTISA
jgi:hypothetical protein